MRNRVYVTSIEPDKSTETEYLTWSSEHRNVLVFVPEKKALFLNGVRYASINDIDNAKRLTSIFAVKVYASDTAAEMMDQTIHTNLAVVESDNAAYDNHHIPYRSNLIHFVQRNLYIPFKFSVYILNKQFTYSDTFENYRDEYDITFVEDVLFMHADERVQIYIDLDVMHYRNNTYYWATSCPKDICVDKNYVINAVNAASGHIYLLDIVKLENRLNEWHTYLENNWPSDWDINLKDEILDTLTLQYVMNNGFDPMILVRARFGNPANEITPDWQELAIEREQERITELLRYTCLIYFRIVANKNVNMYYERYINDTLTVDPEIEEWQGNFDVNEVQLYTGLFEEQLSPAAQHVIAKFTNDKDIMIENQIYGNNIVEKVNPAQEMDIFDRDNNIPVIRP